MPRGDKYINLVKYLETCESDEVTLSFEQIVSFVGDLPSGVYKRAKGLSSALYYSLSNTEFTIHTNFKEQFATFRKAPKQFPHNLTGQCFGKLSVIKKANKKTHDGRVLWKCICSCPKHTIRYLATSDLTTGRYISCGCLAKKSGKANIIKATENLIFVDGTELRHWFSDKIPKNSTTGIKGVYFDKKTQKYRASYKYQGKTYHIKGSFSDPNDAKKARDDEVEKTIIDKYNVRSPQ